ncbi:MAG: 3-hydroxyacyl-CoA dehydrogenase NAD-binding domain-containing protein [Paracoccaceae bacterium]|nr:3-hydroxyacyl-CoA dehydrogenase NAD-binding domain-containing protein [Paracoccaceae bacterium]
MSEFSLEIGTDEIAIVKWDLPNKTLNVLTLKGIEELENIVDELLSTKKVKGVVITSGKKDFAAGMDLNVLADLQANTMNQKNEKIFEFIIRVHKLLRKIEHGGMNEKTKKNGIPFVWANPGLSAGIGTEIGLACHHRIVAEGNRSKVGLPEILVGLFPGAGGATRVSRMVGLMTSAPILMEGKMFSPKNAKNAGLIDEITSSDDLINDAKNWIINATDEVMIKPWDRKGYKMPGGSPYHPNGFMTFVGASAMISSRTKNVYPAAKYLLSAIYEGALTDFDTALRIEARWFTKILTEKSTSNMIRTLFINKNAIEKGLRRPKKSQENKLENIGVVGAGMMGAGITHSAALNGINVTLIDKDLESVNLGISRISQILETGVKRGKLSGEKKQEILNRINPSTNYNDLCKTDLVIEAVFENPEIKNVVLREISNHADEKTIIASNTSTLPITDLANSIPDQESFLGIHFFSPVDKMNLVEIIKGKRTSESTIALAFDFVRQIRKTPIIVNDARNFYANRCIIPYINEGMIMVKEGVPPQVIENAALQLGMPLGPLQLIDEVSIELAISIADQTKKALGNNLEDNGISNVLSLMEKNKRFGRKVGAGFYEYNERGKRVCLWQELKTHFPHRKDQPNFSEVKSRLALIQCLEAVRALESKVLVDIREGDLGAILGWGCMPWAGGPFSWMDLKGSQWIAKECEQLSNKYGTRFQAGNLLQNLAKSNEKFYEKYATTLK